MTWGRAGPVGLALAGGVLSAGLVVLIFVADLNAAAAAGSVAGAVTGIGALAIGLIQLQRTPPPGPPPPAPPVRRVTQTATATDQAAIAQAAGDRNSPAGTASAGPAGSAGQGGTEVEQTAQASGRARIEQTGGDHHDAGPGA